MQRLPKMFGFGRTDEQLLESLRQLVSAIKRRLVDLVIGQMHDYEADIFRLTLTGMPCGSEVVPDKPIKNPKKGEDPIATQKVISWELTVNDLRVKYLEDIADEVSRRSGELGEQFAAMLVVEDMRERRLIVRNELWADATEWVKMNVLDFFGVDSFDELTDNVMAAKLETKIEEIVRRHPETFSVTPVLESIGGRVVVREEIHAKIPSVLSLMAKDIRDFFNAFKFWR